MRRRREPTAAIDDERGDNASVPSRPAALLQDTAGQRHEALAILRDAADRYFIDNRGGTAAEPNHVTILDNERLIYLASARQLSMSGKVACLPMYRDRDPRPDHLIHADKLVARRVARDMDKMIRLGHDFDPEPHERVLQPPDRLFVARNDTRRKDHDIALFERDVGVIITSDASERGARLALAASADHQDLVARHVARFVFGQEPRHIGKIAGLARRLVHAPQRAPDQGDVAVVDARGLGDRLQPRDIRGKTSDGDSPVVTADQVGQGLAQFAFRAGAAGLQRVCRVADDREHALVADLAQSVLIGRRADQRLGIELPIAGVQHRAGRGADHDGVRLGDRMRQRDQLEIERSDLKAAGHRHGRNTHLAGEAALDELCPQHGGGEGGCPDRALQLRPQIRDRADMVLMRVRRDDAEQLVAALHNETRVGHDDIDPRLMLLLAKGDAAIDDQPLTPIAVNVEVHADLA